MMEGYRCYKAVDYDERGTLVGGEKRWTNKESGVKRKLTTMVNRRIKSKRGGIGEFEGSRWG